MFESAGQWEAGRLIVSLLRMNANGASDLQYTDVGVQDLSPPDPIVAITDQGVEIRATELSQAAYNLLYVACQELARARGDAIDDVIEGMGLLVATNEPVSP